MATLPGLQFVDIEKKKAHCKTMDGSDFLMDLPSEDCARRLDEWLNDGELLIQDAVPELSDDQREMFLSGLTAEEYAKL
jgi:hypothetical protein